MMHVNDLAAPLVSAPDVRVDEGKARLGIWRERVSVSPARRRKPSCPFRDRVDEGDCDVKRGPHEDEYDARDGLG